MYKKITLLMILICLHSIAISPMGRLKLAQKSSLSHRNGDSLRVLVNDNGRVKTITIHTNNINKGNSQNIEIPRHFELCMDSARIHANANNIVTTNLPPKNVTGKGVLVGVVDIGFDYTHPAFLDSAGNSRIVAVWDQAAEEGTPPKGFSYGAELFNKADILAAKHCSQPVHSHGAHVAGIIGGSKIEGYPYQGLATECEFIIVSTPMEEDQVIDAVRYVFQKADELGKPAVVNLSLGSTTGPHDGTSLTDLAYEELDAQNKIIVTAGGNSGGHNIHISKDFTPTDTLRTFIDVPWNIHYLDFWGEAKKEFKITFDLYDTTNTKLASLGSLSSSADSLDTTIIVNENDSLQLIAHADDSSTLNGKTNIALMVKDITKNLYKSHKISLTISGEGVIHGWNSSYSPFRSRGLDGYSNGDTNHTIIDGGGCSKGALTIGAMTSKNKYINIYDTLKKGFDNEIVGEIAPFSAIGPTLDGRQKPNIVTPGNMLIAPYNSYFEWKDSTEITDTFTQNGRTYAYGKMSGTSMATPFAAGAVALMLEVNPKLNRTDVMNILKKTAKEDEYTGTFTDDVYSRWGYGKFDVKKAVAEAEKGTAVVTSKKSKIATISAFATPGKIRIHLRNVSGKVQKISLFNVKGQELFTSKVNTKHKEIFIPTECLGQNVLLYKITGDTFTQSGRISF